MRQKFNRKDRKEHKENKMELAIAILGIVSALLGAGIWFWKKRESTLTRQERIDGAIDARLQREHEIDAAIARPNPNAVNNLVEGNLRGKIRREILKNGVINPLVFCLLLTAHCLLSFGCATTPPPYVIPADREINFLRATQPAPADGWFIPPARMHEILRALSDKKLEDDLINAKGVNP